MRVEDDRINDDGYFIIDELRSAFLKISDRTWQATDDNISHRDMRTLSNT